MVLMQGSTRATTTGKYNIYNFYLHKRAGRSGRGWGIRCCASNPDAYHTGEKINLLMIKLLMTCGVPVVLSQTTCTNLSIDSFWNTSGPFLTSGLKIHIEEWPETTNRCLSYMTNKFLLGQSQNSFLIKTFSLF